MSSSIFANRRVVHLDNLNESNLEFHLQAIASALTSFQGARNDFVTVYPIFKRNRESCIQLQKKMADSLDNHQLKCNISTTASTCVSMVGTIVGGAALVIGTGGLAAPAIAAAAPSIAAVGGVSALTGGVTAIGTYIVNKVIEKKYVDKVNMLLESDKIYSEKLFRWIKRTDEVITAIENVMDYDIFEEILKTLKVDIEKFRFFKQKCYSNEMPQELLLCIHNLPISGQQQKHLKELLSHIMKNTECLHLLLTIAALYYTLDPTIKQAFQAFEISIKAFRCLDASFDIGNAAFTVARNTRRATKFLIAVGFLSAVNFAIDLYTLISVSKDISRGSKSEIAKKIRNCTVLLQEELEYLEIIYQGLLI